MGFVAVNESPKLHFLSLSFRASASPLHILLDTALPTRSERRFAAPHMTDGLAHDVEIERRPSLVALVSHGAVGMNADMVRHVNGVHVRAEEQELPAVLFLLLLTIFLTFV